MESNTWLVRDLQHNHGALWRLACKQWGVVEASKPGPPVMPRLWYRWLGEWTEVTITESLDFEIPVMAGFPEIDDKPPGLQPFDWVCASLERPFDWVCASLERPE